VSTIHELPQTVADPATDEAPHTTDRPRTGLPMAAKLGIAAVALATVGTGVTVAVTHRSAPTAKTSDAISMPATISGMNPLPAASDPTQSQGWMAKATAAGKGATVVGRSYGSGQPGGRTIRAVAGRTDLSGALEQAWATGAGTVVGSDQCTNNVRLTPTSAPRVRPTVMLCWRSTSTFSAYAVVIDPKATTPIPATDAATALDTLWTATAPQ